VVTADSGGDVSSTRFLAEEVWHNPDLDAEESIRFVKESSTFLQFRTLLFSRIVPTLRDIGLFGPKVRAAFTDMGVLGFEAVDVEELMASDEGIAEGIDAERAGQVEQTVAAGAQGPGAADGSWHSSGRGRRWDSRAQGPKR